MAEQNDVCSFFRKPSSKNRSNIRKRNTNQESSGSESDNPNPSHKPNKKTLTPTDTKNKLLFSTSKPVPKPESESNNPPSSTSSSSSFYFESSKEIQTHHDSRATATLETETDFSNDARAIRERALKRAEANLRSRPSGSAGAEAAAAAKEEKVYKGMHGYTDYKAGFRREQTVAAEKAGGAHGPLRASAHIRTSARFDYQPDICKDYKETGYCGFGDACKFMHDRGDYKSGWQMEKEWDEKEKARKRALAMGGGGDDDDNNDDDDDSDEEALPFACFICRQPFEDPVVTKCKHYFCEHCALKHHSKNKKCFVCNKPTLGIFNTAHEIRKRMAQEK